MSCFNLKDIVLNKVKNCVFLSKSSAMLKSLQENWIDFNAIWKYLCNSGVFVMNT